jgi:Flp pilus assembly protein TadG
VSRHCTPTTTRERGAAAVELAIILPLLLLIVFGIIEFGRGYEVKVQLTGSVREGARALALGQSQAEVEQAVIDAAPGLNPALTAADISMTPCPGGGADGNATVTVSYDLPSLTPLVPGGSIGIDVTGVMRCGL